MKSKFIVFEGIDGSGKGTQIKLLSNCLYGLSKDIHIVLTREPTTDSKEGREIRSLLKSGMNSRENAKLFTDLFIADRTHHVNNLILPSLQYGAIVICDRYLLSTLAYQQTQGLELKYLIEKHKDLPNPDITFLLDLPVKLAFKRRKEEGATEIFDRDLEFQRELKRNYLDLISDYSLIKINANKTPEEIHKKIVDHLQL